MEPLEDRSELVALGLLQVTGSESIFTHGDCKTNAVSGGFSGLCTHCLLRQLISEHHPNKAVSAQHQWPTCTKGLSLAGPRPRLGGLHVHRQMLRAARNSLAGNTSPCDCKLRKAEPAVLRKSSPLTPVQPLAPHQGPGTHQRGPAGGGTERGWGCDTHRCRAEGTAAAPLITPLPALPQGPPPFLSRFATRCLPILAPHTNSTSPKGCAPTCLVHSTLLNPQ